MPLWMSPVCVIPGKNIQFGIMVFLEVQEINLQDNMRGSFVFTSTPRDVFN